MIDSKGSVVVGDQGAQGGLVAVVVVPDRGGQGQAALQDPNPDPSGGVAPVLLKVQLAFEGGVDRLDELP